MYKIHIHIHMQCFVALKYSTISICFRKPKYLGSTALESIVKTLGAILTMSREIRLDVTSGDMVKMD